MSAAPLILADRLRGWRHDLHQIPETGRSEETGVPYYVNLARSTLPIRAAT